MIKKKRYRNDSYDLYDGLHEPIVSQEVWDKAKAAQRNRDHPSNHIAKEIKNPFVTILVCEKCGAIMKRNVPAKNQRTAPWYRCPTRGCECKQMKCTDVEKAIVEAMREWLTAYKIQVENGDTVSTNHTTRELEIVNGQLEQLQTQQNSLCEYLEKGIYTVDMFTRRNTILQNDIQKLQEAKVELEKKRSEQESAQKAATEIISTTQHILDNYDLLTPAQKNNLWKLVLKKATMFRSETKGPLRVKLYPNLPQ